MSRMEQFLKFTVSWALVKKAGLTLPILLIQFFCVVELLELSFTWEGKSSARKQRFVCLVGSLFKDQ